MASLRADAMARLPDELWDAILDHFRTPRTLDYVMEHDARPRLQTLANLSLTSHRMYRLAQPAMYRFLDLPVVRQKNYKLVLQNLCRNQVLRSAVRGICVQSFNPWESEDDSNNIALSDEGLVELYEPCLRQVDLPEDVHARLRDGLLRGHEGAEIACMIVLCPNVSLLTFIHDFGLSSSLIMSVVEAGARPLTLDSERRRRPLQRLRSIDIPHWNSEGSGLKLTEISEFLRLPALDTVHLERALCTGPLGMSKASNTVRRMQLRSSLLDPQALESLLTLFPNLETLDISVSTDFDEFYQGLNKSITPSQLGDILCRKGVNLRSLIFWDDCYPEEPPIRTLSRLTSLVHFCLPEQALVRCWPRWMRKSHSKHGTALHEDSPHALAEKLAPSLRSLEIIGFRGADDHTSTDVQLLELMRDPPPLKDLRSIRMLRHIHWKNMMWSQDLTGLLWRFSETRYLNDHVWYEFCRIED